MDAPAIVFDNGSEMSRVGFAGNNAPCSTFPTIVGHSKRTNGRSLDAYIGDEAQTRRGLLDIEYPVDHGIVSNWDDMVMVIKFQSLCIHVLYCTVLYNTLYTYLSLSFLDLASHIL